MTRFLFLFVFVASLHVSAALHSQNKMVTLHLEGVSLEEVIQSLKLQTDYGFFYNIDSKDIKNSQKNGKIWINKVSVWY